MPRNKIFGSQTPISGDVSWFVAKAVEKRDRKTKVAPSPMPTAKWMPAPPLSFREATAMPIRVRIIIVTDSAVLL
jgi:hypothetical protein